MAEISKNGSPSLATVVPCDSARLPSILVGEDIAAGDACYIKSDGKVWRSNGASGGVLGTTAEVDGFALLPAKVAQRQSVALYHDVNVTYATGLTPGAFLYLSTTVLGGLTDTVGTRQVKPIARVVDATRLRVFRTY